MCKMSGLLLAVAFICIFNIFGVEVTSRIIFERVHIEKLNNFYYGNDSLISIDNEDDNYLTAKVEVINPIPETNASMQVFVASSEGKYDIPMDINFVAPFCEMIDEPKLLKPFFDAIGITEDNCPPAPGLYGFESYSLPVDHIPDWFPPNKYMTEFSLSIDSNIILQLLIFSRSIE